MVVKSALLATAGLAASALAQEATVTITASRGGAGNNLSNTTIDVPLGQLYTDDALSTVSYLYLTGASGASLESITCIPHRFANGTGEAGNPFTSSSPSFLSLNTVQVGSLTCDSTETGAAGSNSTSLSSTSSSAAGQASTSTAANGTITSTSSTPSMTTSASNNGTAASPMTSTFLTTIPGSSVDGSTRAAQQSTVTSVMMASGSTTVTSSGGEGAAETDAASTAASSTSAVPTLGNTAPKMTFGDAVWPALAVGALGVAVVV